MTKTSCTLKQSITLLFLFCFRISYLIQPDFDCGPCVEHPWHVGDRQELVQSIFVSIPKYVDLVKRISLFIAINPTIEF